MSENKEATTVEGAMVNTNTGEISQTREAVTALQEIQGAMIMSRRFPRDEKKAFGKMDIVCKRTSLAKVAQYSYPRGQKQIKGASVYLARELARCWGNVRYGIQVVSDTETHMTIRGWAWDVEANNKVEIEDTFKKSIQRKKDGRTQWVTPDERDLRELVMKHGAIASRGAIFGILPRDFVEDGIMICSQTLAQGIKDPDAEIKNLIIQFNRMKIPVEKLNKYVGTDSWTADEIVELTGVLNAIKDGAKIKAYFGEAEEPKKKIKGELSDADMSPGKAEEHQDIRTGLADKTEPETKDDPPEDKPEVKLATIDTLDHIYFLLETKAFGSAKLAKLNSEIRHWRQDEGITEADGIKYKDQLEELKDLT